ncbi:two-component system regulatory protein YycI [Bacillus sp. FJAT-50079]|uniref:two-component system regulatory protein YycI n=1 Tax=Bacillus sp. FJAT-50079 TaxID=2833577 RepID=UPI001BCA277F|nr:two-component system regulatory protein YycI [Bacillus sp. FJAT-50079]MBS4207134.1 two-component system regulatory protein YycI [Bacillus sp. FJAT-50079]
MDWSRIKTIYIVAFLILDLFLVSQLVTKHQTNKLEVKSDATLEENLKTDGIVYENLPKDIPHYQYMSANTKTFTEDELKELKNQEITIEDNSIIHSELDETIKLSEKDFISELNSLIKANILYGDQYSYWDYDKEAMKITYYQTFNDQQLLMNGSAHLVFYVNEFNEIYAYDQTMLEIGEPLNQEEEVLTAIRSLEILYRKGMLKPNSWVKKVEMGYYTLVSMEESQVLTPTWHLDVEHDGEREHLLVNAFDGQIIQMNTINQEKKTME